MSLGGTSDPDPGASPLSGHSQQAGLPEEGPPVKELLRRLGHDGLMYLGRKQGRQFQQEHIASAEVPARVEQLRPDHDLWFSLNDFPPGKSRSAVHVRRWISFMVDIDFAPDKMRTCDLAEQLLVGLSERLTPPTAVIESGHGLQPIWAIRNSLAWTGQSDSRRRQAQDLLAGVKNLVDELARELGGSCDSVFDLARFARAPGTTNFKDRALPVPTVLRPGPYGVGLSPDELRIQLGRSPQSESTAITRRKGAVSPRKRATEPPTAGAVPNAKDMSLLKCKAAWVEGTEVKRNNRLHDAAYFTGRETDLAEELVQDVLLGTARLCGLEPEEITPTIRSGFRSGREDQPARTSTTSQVTRWNKGNYEDHVWESTLCSRHKLALLTMLNFMGGGAPAYPSLTKAAKAAGLSRTNISQLLGELVEHGWLIKTVATWTGRSGRPSNAYWLPPSDTVPTTPEHCTRPSKRTDNLKRGKPRKPPEVRRPGQASWLAQAGLSPSPFSPFPPPPCSPPG